MEISLDILEYVQRIILPQYAAFDKGHGLEHVNNVINNSIAIARNYDVDLDKVYVIAAYHDIGLGKDRKNHHKTSSAYLLSDIKLREWFSIDELIMMSEAIEDHRASNNYRPRSIYGMIVSEADRDLEYTTVLKRTIQYSISNYPKDSIEQHFARIYEHICNKFGENGYLNLWLNTEINQRYLQELRSMIVAKEKLWFDFKVVFYVCLM